MLCTAKKQAWFLDQYKNPHESSHSIGEILRWFDKTGFEFINSLPKADLLDSFTKDESIFDSHSCGTSLDHFLIQSKLLLNGGQEGGFFTMIGRKKHD